MVHAAVTLDCHSATVIARNIGSREGQKGGGGGGGGSMFLEFFFIKWCIPGPLLLPSKELGSS